jgi:hypothetical protein
LEYISTFSHLLPLFTFLFFIKRNKNFQTRVIFFYCLYAFFNDLLLQFAPTTALISILLSVFTVVEFTFFSIVLYTLIVNSAIKKAIVLISFLFIISCIFIYFTSSNSPFDAIAASLEAVIIITFTIYYLYEQNNKPEITFIYLSYTFWITFAFLIYLSGTFFLFIQSSSLPEETISNFWGINLVCNILKNILFAVAFSMQKTDSKANYL